MPDISGLLLEDEYQQFRWIVNQLYYVIFQGSEHDSAMLRVCSYIVFKAEHDSRLLCLSYFQS